MERFTSNPEVDPSILEGSFTSLQEYDTYIRATGTEVDLEVIELFARTGDEVAISYLEHVQAAELLFQELDPLLNQLNNATPDDCMVLVETILVTLDRSTIPNEQKQAILQELVSPQVEAVMTQPK